MKSVKTTLNRVKIFQNKWKSLQKKWLQKSKFHRGGGGGGEALTEGQLKTKELSLCELPKNVIFTLLE